MKAFCSNTKYNVDKRCI